MKKQMIKLICFVGILALSSCRPTYRITNVEGSMTPIDSTWDAHPDTAAAALLAPYKAEIGKVMYRVIGTSAMPMEKGRPESLLSNLVADVLKQAAADVLGHPADVGLVNMGGLRANLPAGNITINDIYEICPFENALCVLTLTGSEMKRFCEDMARVGGPGVSGVKLTITKDGRLVDATVGGRPIDEARTYTVGTIDYLAEGNDGMTTLMNITRKQCPDDSVLRDLFIRYVEKETAAGRQITSRIEGRVTVVDNEQ
ncbi:MAG: 5'-nucleotidase C-terminal domain-containing protein [Prevotellaceae bacterium]|jgi:2',3'-cyclic-nucleotide 2'-phosphodiesterase (5'-nucleotidase family)|nr:5'-nucleotidase C-terminal domain-containing protein [Prevotellaceae bacterium]